MAEQRTCDYKGCGKSPAWPVEVGVSLWNVVAPGAPTGHTEALDSCEEHQQEVALALHEHCVEQLAGQVDFHREVFRLDAEIMEQATLISGTRAALREFESVEAAPKNLQTEHARALDNVVAAEEARAKVLAEATVASDKAKAKLLKSVSK